MQVFLGVVTRDTGLRIRRRLGLVPEQPLFQHPLLCNCLSINESLLKQNDEPRNLNKELFPCSRSCLLCLFAFLCTPALISKARHNRYAEIKTYRCLTCKQISVLLKQNFTPLTSSNILFEFALNFSKHRNWRYISCCSWNKRLFESIIYKRTEKEKQKQKRTIK